MSTSRDAWAVETLSLLRTLPAVSATVVALRYFLNCDEAQICARTGWTADTVRNAAAEGLRALGQLLLQNPRPTTATNPTVA